MQNYFNFLTNISNDFMQQFFTVVDKFVLFAPDFTTFENSTINKISFQNINTSNTVFSNKLFLRNNSARLLGIALWLPYCGGSFYGIQATLKNSNLITF